MSPHTTLRSETGSPCEFQEPFTREKSVAKSANERAQRSTAMAGVAPLTRSPPAQRRDPGGPRSADQVKVPPRPCAPLPWRRSRRRGWCSEDGGVSGYRCPKGCVHALHRRRAPPPPIIPERVVCCVARARATLAIVHDQRRPSVPALRVAHALLIRVCADGGVAWQYCRCASDAKRPTPRAQRPALCSHLHDISWHVCCAQAMPRSHYFTFSL